MEYELYHKNVNVASVDYTPEAGLITNVKAVEKTEHLPIGTYHENKKQLAENLNGWWKSRMVPENRKKLSKSEMPSKDFASFLAKSCGFNLTDQYWMKPKGSDITWEKGNFFLNPFSEDIGKYLAERKLPAEIKMSSDTPDLFSNGEQDKRWVIMDGTRHLLKYGKNPYCQEPINEALASEICRRLGFDHVPYRFIVKGKKEPRIYSDCECFADSGTELVPAGFVMRVLKKNNYA